MGLSSTKNARNVITLTAREISEACGGRLLCGNEATPVGAISTDTRVGLEGALFIALKGENFDGAEFAPEAMAGGAMGIVVEAAAAQAAADTQAGRNGSAAVVIAVEDSGRALRDIAAVIAARSDASVVAITGSSGKTSTKDILYSLLVPQMSVVASRASFNNEVGVPLTLLSLEDDTEVAVVEMGMQAPGEIRALCEVAAPEIAIITNIGPAHLQYAGSLENIARGKAEIAQGLPPGGGLVIPHGEDLLRQHLMGLDVQKLTFGFDEAADVHTVGFEHLEDGRLSCTIDCVGERIDVCFNFAARHHVLNAMAAIGAYRFLGMPLDSVAEVARNLHLPALRGELIELDGGGALLNDCYNANPLSMRSSLEYLLSVCDGRRTVAVLGDMGELGPQSADWHRQVGGMVWQMGVDHLIAVGEQARGYIEGARQAGNSRQYAHFETREEAVAAVPGLIEPGDVVLVKASRFMRLEQLSNTLLGPDGQGGETGSLTESL